MRRNWPVIRRHVRYGQMALAALLLEAMVLQRFQVLGVTLTALPVAAVAVAMREKPVPAGMWGYAMGWLCDAITPHSEAYHAIALLIICAAVAWACRVSLRPSWPLALLLTAGTLLIVKFFYFLLFYFIPMRAPLSAMPVMVLLTATLSAPLSLAAYPLGKRRETLP